MKKDTYYFSHDYNARNDRKLIKVKHKLRQAGIGIYWSIIEMLYEENGKIDLCEIPSIALDLKEAESKVLSVINDFDLFKKDEKSFWSESVKRRLDKRLEKTEKAKASASHRWQNANGMRTQSEGNAIKESKVNKKKGNIYTPPTVEQVVEYFLENGYSEDSAKTAFKYYNDNDWHDSNGKKVIGWKQKMVGNWFHGENKIKSGKKQFVA